MTLIGNFLTGSYKVTRRGAGYYKDGFFNHGKDQSLVVRGTMLPLSAREISMVEEGDRLKALYEFYTDVPVLVNNARSLSGADRITVNGDTYKVISIEHWQGTRFPYFKAVIAREPQQVTDA